MKDISITVQSCGKRNSKRIIINLFSKVLKFPSYHRYNWDSFEECLFEILSENDFSIEIHHEGWKDVDIDDLKMYFDILDDLSKKFSRFKVTFSRIEGASSEPRG